MKEIHQRDNTNFVWYVGQEAADRVTVKYADFEDMRRDKLTLKEFGRMMDLNQETIVYVYADQKGSVLWYFPGQEEPTVIYSITGCTFVQPGPDDLTILMTQ